MKKVKSCVVENCVPTPSSCVEWNGGDIAALGICNGDSINNVVWEIIAKLEELAGEDISGFDIDDLLSICNQKAPTEVNLVRILELLKQNNICLKDYIDTLSEQISELSKEQKVSVNLRCYQDYDNLGNALQISRDQLDQLVINELCSHETQLAGLSGKVINLQEQIDNLSTSSTVEEINISTCVDPVEKPTSSQVISVAQAHCDLETAAGNPTEYAQNIAKLSDADINWDTIFSGDVEWIATTTGLNGAENMGALNKIVRLLWKQVKDIQDTCCAISCDDIKLGFSASYNEDSTSIILYFNYAVGTQIPTGIIDKGSTGTFKDRNGVVVPFNLTIANNAEIEIPIPGIDVKGPVDISLTPKMGNNTLLCQKCLSRTLTGSTCGVCEISATGPEGSSAVIVYYDDSVVATPVLPTTTTTTTTIAPTTTTTTTLP